MSDRHWKPAPTINSMVRGLAGKYLRKGRGSGAGGYDDLVQIGLAVAHKTQRPGVPNSHVYKAVDRAMQRQCDRIGPCVTVSDCGGRSIARGEKRHPGAFYDPAFSETGREFEASNRPGSTMSSYSYRAARGAERELIRIETAHSLARAVADLSDGLRRLTTATFGLDDRGEQSEREIAAAEGVSHSTVGRKKHTALREIARGVNRPPPRRFRH